MPDGQTVNALLEPFEFVNEQAGDAGTESMKNVDAHRRTLQPTIPIFRNRTPQAFPINFWRFPQWRRAPADGRRLDCTS